MICGYLMLLETLVFQFFLFFLWWKKCLFLSGSGGLSPPPILVVRPQNKKTFFCVSTLTSFGHIRFASDRSRGFPFSQRGVGKRLGDQITFNLFHWNLRISNPFLEYFDWSRHFVLRCQMLVIQTRKMGNFHNFILKFILKWWFKNLDNLFPSVVEFAVY